MDLFLEIIDSHMKHAGFFLKLYFVHLINILSRFTHLHKSNMLWPTVCLVFVQRFRLIG